MIRFLTALALLSGLIPVHASDELRAFPSPAPGESRHVLTLPAKPDEPLFQVELIVGKKVLLDPGNRYFFGGKIEEETIPGWGYPRYVVKKLGPMAGTLMATDPSLPKKERMITLGGSPYLIRYNSRLPVVVYVPEGVEVRYRLWTTDAEPRIIEER
jgi:ecotin